MKAVTPIFYALSIASLAFSVFVRLTCGDDINGLCEWENLITGFSMSLFTGALFHFLIVFLPGKKLENKRAEIVRKEYETLFGIVKTRLKWFGLEEADGMAQFQEGLGKLSYGDQVGKNKMTVYSCLNELADRSQEFKEIAIPLLVHSDDHEILTMIREKIVHAKLFRRDLLYMRKGLEELAGQPVGIGGHLFDFWIDLRVLGELV